jgi:hypothetical protein
MATSHHHPTLLLDSSSKRMCSDSDLGLVTLQVRDQVLHRGHDPPLWLPQLGSPHRPAADLTSGKLLTSHVPPRGHVTLTHDTLAAKHITALRHCPCCLPHFSFPFFLAPCSSAQKPASRLPRWCFNIWSPVDPYFGGNPPWFTGIPPGGLHRPAHR